MILISYKMQKSSIFIVIRVVYIMNVIAHVLICHDYHLGNKRAQSNHN